MSGFWQWSTVRFSGGERAGVGSGTTGPGPLVARVRRQHAVRRDSVRSLLSRSWKNAQSLGECGQISRRVRVFEVAALQPEPSQSEQLETGDSASHALGRVPARFRTWLNRKSDHTACHRRVREQTYRIDCGRTIKAHQVGNWSRSVAAGRHGSNSEQPPSTSRWLRCCQLKVDRRAWALSPSPLSDHAGGAIKTPGTHSLRARLNNRLPGAGASQARPPEGALGGPGFNPHTTLSLPRHRQGEPTRGFHHPRKGHKSARRGKAHRIPDLASHLGGPRPPAGKSSGCRLAEWLAQPQLPVWNPGRSARREKRHTRMAMRHQSTSQRRQTVARILDWQEDL